MLTVEGRLSWAAAGGTFQLWAIDAHTRISARWVVPLEHVPSLLSIFPRDVAVIIYRPSRELQSTAEEDPQIAAHLRTDSGRGDRNFGYLLGDRDTKQGVLIGRRYSREAFVQRATEQGLRVTHVINTMDMRITRTAMV